MYAVIDNGIVVNIVAWDGDTNKWQPPSGLAAIEVTDATGPAYIGCAYASGRFAEPPQPPVIH